MKARKESSSSEDPPPGSWRTSSLRVLPQRKGQGSSLRSPTRSLTPSWGPTLHTQSPPKAPSPNTITLGVRISTYELGRRGTQHSVHNLSLLIPPGTCRGGLTCSPLNLGSVDLSLTLNAGREAPTLVLGPPGCCFRGGGWKPWDSRNPGCLHALETPFPSH